ncbi:MAG TPA: GAF and ANTAR domain-containing protein [Microlunatus sp.]
MHRVAELHRFDSILMFLALTSNRAGDTQMTITLTSPDAPVQAEPADVEAMAQDMFSPARLPGTLDRILSLSEQTFGGDAAGFLLSCGDQATIPVAAARRDAARADVLQVDLREGPGWQAIARRQPVIVSELRFDSRWRFWSPLVADLGFRSVLSLSLTDGDTSGALNLYSRRPSRFDSADLALAQAFAAHAAIAVAVAAEREQLLRAVQTRAIVGQAQVRLMERHHLTADRALTALRRYASHTGQDPQLIAQRVIDDRNLRQLHPPATTSPDAASADNYP